MKELQGIELAWERIDRIIADRVHKADLKSLVNPLLDVAAVLTQTNSLYVRVLDESEQFLDIVVSKGPYEHVAEARKRIGDSVSGYVVKHSK